MAITIYDIAEKAGTTHATVSRALKDNPRISEATRKKIKKIANELGYRPNFNARSFGSGKTYSLGFITPNLKNPYYVDLLRAFEAECSLKEYSVMVFEYESDETREKKCLEDMLEQRCDAAVAIITNYNLLEGLIDEFRRRKIPLMIPGLPGGSHFKNYPVDGTLVNHKKGMEKAIDHLVDLGHKEIIFASSCIKEFANLGRLEGFESAFKKNLLNFSEERIVNKFSGDELRDGYDVAFEIFKKNPKTSAIIGTNDIQCVGILRALKDMGLSVPNQVSVLGCDNTWIAQYSIISLTSLDSKTTFTAKALTNIIFKRLEQSSWDEPEIVKIEPDLVIRESTGKLGG
ncbi:MAG: LacI family DNA-binding transcriptional regulator [Phycisphaerales bacterium]